MIDKNQLEVHLRKPKTMKLKDSKNRSKEMVKIIIILKINNI